MDIERMREQLRTYLKAHKQPQGELAESLGVSHSWLNKFVNGRFQDVQLGRLQRLHDWMIRDKKVARKP